MELLKSFKGKGPNHIGSTGNTKSRPPAPEKHAYSDEYAPPPGPPPSLNPPPYHDWESAVPDTSTLPPPPALPNLSSKNNASYSTAERGHAFVARFPMYTPSMPSEGIYTAVQTGRVGLERPVEFMGELKDVEGAVVWRVKTKQNQGDCVLLSTLPMYFAARDSPLRTERAVSVYYEVRILGISNDVSAVAVGFAVKPYPGWRLPGWHRGSVGVHGDDGRRFVNDSWGGVDFVGAFRVGETVGIGMRFGVPEGGGGNVKAKTEVFFTRGGRKEGWWWVDEERDAERDEGVEGLQGATDMYAAVGCCGGVEFEVVFDHEGWMFRPN